MNSKEARQIAEDLINGKEIYLRENDKTPVLKEQKNISQILKRLKAFLIIERKSSLICLETAR